MLSGRKLKLRRGRGFDAYLFYAGRFVRDAARSLMAVLSVIYLTHVGLENTEVGIVFGASLAGGFVLSMVVMLTSRAISTRVWSVTHMFLTGLTGVVLIMSNDFWLLVIGGFFGSYAASGAHWGAMTQLEQTGIASVIPQARRTRAYSILTISSSAGRAVGALLAGVSTFLIQSLDWGRYGCLPCAAVGLRSDASSGGVGLRAAVVGQSHTSERGR